MNKTFVSCLCASVLFYCSAAVSADTQPRFILEVEAGATWQQKNDVQIPNDSEGDRFDLTEIAGEGPWPTLRLNGIWNISEKHGVRIVLAPLEIEETGRLAQDVRFNGETFLADTPADARYRFNSWRIGYRYQYLDSEDWNLWVGATAKIRDAEITLHQGDRRSTDDDVGFVPLLYLAGEYRINDKWRFEFDFDGLAGGPGRAFDVSLKLGYDINDRWRLSAGYRGLEGGADTDDVYNFAWFNTAMASAQFRF